MSKFSFTYTTFPDNVWNGFARRVDDNLPNDTCEEYHYALPDFGFEFDDIDKFTTYTNECHIDAELWTLFALRFG